MPCSRKICCCLTPVAELGIMRDRVDRRSLCCQGTFFAVATTADPFSGPAAAQRDSLGAWLVVVREGDMRSTSIQSRDESRQQTAAGGRGRWCWHGVAGLLLVIVFWTLNWSLDGLRTHWAFFPLWLGYCLTVDGLVYWRRGHSMATRDPVGYAMLFLISAPGWWLFELLNLRTQNWEYLGAEQFTNLQYFLLCSLSFSTVMPAVFGTAELVNTMSWVHRWKAGPVFALTSGVVLGLFCSGWLMLALLLIWPRYCFPLLWGAVYLILDPINVWFGRRSLLVPVARGDWRLVLTLPIGCLICAFFWEMWNYESYPKWVYHVPFVDVLHVFEMPLLGYLGYIPFSWELFALHGLLCGGSAPHSSAGNRKLMAWSD